MVVSPTLFNLPGCAVDEVRLTASALVIVAHTTATSGEAAARVGRTLQLPTSPDTLLRSLHQAPLPDRPTPRVPGLDDFAFRKRHTYGSLLVDLEQHQPIDMLPDRTAATLAEWLNAHPGVE